MRKTGWIFLAAGAALLAGLFALFKPAPPPAQGAAAPAGNSASARAGSTRDPHIVEIVVKEGRLAAGPATVTVRQNDVVSLIVTADRADELHLHGYDLAVALRPGVPSRLMFTASRSGRFDYELHSSHAGIGVLEVMPR